MSSGNFIGKKRIFHCQTETMVESTKIHNEGFCRKTFFLFLYFMDISCFKWQETNEYELVITSDYKFVKYGFQAIVQVLLLFLISNLTRFKTAVFAAVFFNKYY